MNQARALELAQAADETAFDFSRTDRGGNPGGETFKVDRIIVLGETTAAVVFLKNTGKKAVCFYYYDNSRAHPRWAYFFITYAHLSSLRHVEELLFEIEQHNYQISSHGA